MKKVLGCLLLAAVSACAQNLDYSALKWRSIGPFRAGRVSAVAGVPSEPMTYYIGTPGGGVWKTTDAGQVWTPISDSVPVASIGAVAVAYSNPEIVYMGTGEQTQGNGVYKSTDAGKTWTHVGLEQTHVITSLLVDPKNPDVVYAGVQGDKWSGDQRGVFRTLDGGKTWKRTLFVDEKKGVMDLAIDPDERRVMYAALWQLPERGRREPSKQQDGFIYKSSDGGETWTAVEGKGLPEAARGRIGVITAPGSRGNTVFAICTQGFFKSVDGGATWTQPTKDPRVIGNSYFGRVFIDPKDANVLYVAQTSMYRSTDGGATWQAWQGAPSGDDYHLIWTNPIDTRYKLLGVDQGAVISVNNGKTWSSWYNQATGQFYHVSTDNHYPYYVYAAQQDSGTEAVASRSDFGEITAHDYAPTGGFEFAFIAPDPAHPNWVYTGGWYGSVLRFDKVTGQVTHLFVRTERYRTANMAPIVFSPQDATTMYIGAQYVLKTTNGGVSFEEISPDLTENPDAKPEEPAKPEEKDKKPPKNTATITTLSPSAVKAGVMWAGTSNGLVQVTRDGKTWQRVTPAGLPQRAMVSAVEASRHDPAEAYAVINVRDDQHPYVFRTRDYGQTWTPITQGMAPDAIARVVREDLKRKGLLFAGNETGAYVSFDDGEHWRALQTNLPITSVRDLEVHGDDLVAATYGRGLFILDDITPLRQLGAEAPRATVLLRPADAVRVRWDVNQDTPLPVETPAAKNPPDGAIVDFYLPAAATGEAKLAIFDSKNQLVREVSSKAEEHHYLPANVPDYWFTEDAVLPTKAGLNRFVWDLRYPAPKTLSYSYYGNRLDYVEYTLMEHAIPGETPHDIPLGALVTPGQYTVALTVNGKTYRQPLMVTLDPRVKVSGADLEAQLDLERRISEQMSVSYEAFDAADHALAQMDKGKANAPAELGKCLGELEEQGKKIANGNDDKELGFGPVNRELARLMEMVSTGDAAPASGLVSGASGVCQQLANRISDWESWKAKVDEVNGALKSANQPAIEVTGERWQRPTCPTP